jgi:hypothetical protein
VVVVDRDFFLDHDLFNDHFRGSVDEDQCASNTSSQGQGGIPFLHFDELDDRGVPFLELFADPSGWSGSNAAFDPDPNHSAPDEPSFDLFSAQTGSLLLGFSSGGPAQASVSLTGLVPGHRYVVTGWSNRGDFEVRINTPPPPALNVVGGRFKIEVRWDVSNRIASGELLTDQTAGFWFNTPNTVEMIVSATNHCTPTGGTFWLLLGGTTAQRLRITVTDQQTGIRKTYSNGAQTRLAPVVDKTTFRCF